MEKGFWITVGLSGLIALFAFFIFIVWRPILVHQEIKKEESAPAKIDQKTAGKEEIKPSELKITINKFIQNAETPKDLEFKPFFEKEEEKIKETFLEKFSVLIGRQILAEIKPESVSGLDKTEPARQVSDENILTDAPKRALNDEEWFKIAYPDYYLDALKGIEQFMREQGFLTASEKFEFKTEKEIYTFAYRIMDFALAKNFIDETQVKNFRYGIEVVLPGLQKEERRQWSQQLSVLLLNLFKTKTAWAQVVKDCYRQGASIGTGSNTPWPICCNCGLGYVGETIMWYNDCGYGLISEITCNVKELGCLNSVCSYPKPAIWDPIGICGCG